MLLGLHRIAVVSATAITFVIASVPKEAAADPYPYPYPYPYPVPVRYPVPVPVPVRYPVPVPVPVRYPVPVPVPVFVRYPVPVPVPDDYPDIGWPCDDGGWPPAWRHGYRGGFGRPGPGFYYR
jgi:hypothetical protein